jgi:hypothetical protein
VSTSVITLLTRQYGVLREAGEHAAEDPFRGLLDGAGVHNILETSAPPLDPASLRITDVHNLMACTCNRNLPHGLRCSAVQQLGSLAGDPAFLSVLAVPSFLENCLVEVERAVGIQRANRSRALNEPDGRSDGGVGDNDDDDVDDDDEVVPLSIFQMQLPVACLVLLGSLATNSCGVLVRFRTEQVMTACRRCIYQDVTSNNISSHCFP